MAKLNRKTSTTVKVAPNHEGVLTKTDTPMRELRRAVLCCLLWEDTFYESGEDIATRIQALVANCVPSQVVTLAVEARTKFNLRHVPLLLIASLVKNRKVAGTSLISDAIEVIIQRPDEMGELLAIYQKLNGKRTPIANQITKGLAKVFCRFTEYQLAKYNRKGEGFTLRDVMFKVHPKPIGAEQVRIFKQLADNTLPSPDTWEVELSAGKDKKETFTRLLKEGKLGYFALLRNLRNMHQAGVDFKLVTNALRARKGGAEKILPFRFIAAYRAAPEYREALNDAMLAGLSSLPEFEGRTVIYVDVSISMYAELSGKSDLSRSDAAAALAAIFPSENVVIHTFESEVRPTKNYGRGLNAVDKIRGTGGTNFKRLFAHISALKKVDRVIVITDEQSQTPTTYNVKDIGQYRYMINVGGYKQSIVTDKDWVRIDGFSENVFRFMHEWEKAGDAT